MTRAEIDNLLYKGIFPDATCQRQLIETHISWVILCDRFVYKIKKPIKYSFLDFSTLEKRKYFCERELQLNRRFAENIYLEVMPIYKLGELYKIAGKKGTIIDYTLKMRKLDPQKQMDVLVENDNVTPTDIKNLSKCIADFHKRTTIIYEKDVQDVREKFNDLNAEKEFLSQNLDMDTDQLINHAIGFSNTFLDDNTELLESRLQAGLFRDCHGDLHTRNIFLLPKPQPFDCIEFNDDYRYIDILNEVAFLCMDLDALDRVDMSSLLIEQYHHLFPVIRTDIERRLFTYYKCYRANVRAKVNSLRAQSATETITKTKALAETGKYLLLMQRYIKSLEDS